MESFPPIPLDAWRETKETLHRFAQVVGQDPAGRQRPPQPLVERAVPRDRARHHHAADGPRPDLHHRLRLRRPSPRRQRRRRPPGVVPTRSTSRWRRSTAPRSTRSMPRRRGRHRSPSPFDLPDTTPFPDDTAHRDLRPGLGQPLLEGAQPGQPAARGVRQRVLRQGQPGAPLLAHARHRRHPLLRSPGDDGRIGRRGDARGLLAGGDQQRLLVRRRQGADAGLLLLHRARARRPGRCPADARDGPVDRVGHRPSRPAPLRRRPRRRPTFGPRCSRSSTAPTTPAPTWPGGTPRSSPARAGSPTRSQPGTSRTEPVLSWFG